MNFTQKLNDVRQEALNYIHSVLRARGTNYELIDPSTYEDGIEDEVYDLPRGFNVNKYEFYDEYPIVVINIENDELSFYGIQIGEGNDDYTFDSDSLTTDTICAIADLVRDLEN